MSEANGISAASAKKNVKKIPGAPMGMVTMTKEKSLLIEVSDLKGDRP